MEAAPISDRSYCTTCGWLLPDGARATCAACGGDATPLPLVDNTRPLARDDEDDTSLAGAKEAWAFGDHARAISLALTFDAAPRSFPVQHGAGWVAAVGETPVFTILDLASSQVTLEVPVVRLPQTKRVPVLRAVAQLCNTVSAVTRFCLRLDIVIVRCAARIDTLTPGLLRRLAREIAAHAGRAQEMLVATFDARPAVPEQGVLSAWERLGRAQLLTALAPASSSALPPPSVSQPPSRPAQPPSRPAPSYSAEVGAPRAPSFPAETGPQRAVAAPSAATTQQIPAARPITLRLSIPPVLAADDDDMPAVLAPDFADDPPPTASAPRDPAPPPPIAPPTMPPPPREPTVPPPPREPTPGPAPVRPSMLPSALPAVPALGLGPRYPSTGALRAVAPREPPLPQPTPLPSAPSASETGEIAPPSRRPPAASTPEGRLCDLLRQALALATALSFEEKPHAMLLLVRAAVFRAVYDHHEAVPNAVSYLVRATRQVTREIWSTRPDPSRPSGPIPVADAALGALEQVVAARAMVPKEKPAAAEPWTTAAQAKENLARYVVEIELSPPDPTLRHYLALGALSELLSRTRLPAATEQRIRDIVAYAQRDGAKPQVIDLMMTALRKIVSG